MIFCYLKQQHSYVWKCGLSVQIHLGATVWLFETSLPIKTGSWMLTWLNQGASQSQKSCSISWSHRLESELQSASSFIHAMLTLWAFCPPGGEMFNCLDCVCFLSVHEGIDVVGPYFPQLWNLGFALQLVGNGPYMSYILGLWPPNTHIYIFNMFVSLEVQNSHIQDTNYQESKQDFWVVLYQITTSCRHHETIDSLRHCLIKIGKWF